MLRRPRARLQFPQGRPAGGTDLLFSRDARYASLFLVWHAMTAPDALSTGGMIAFHRPDFHAVLLRHLPTSCRACTAKRILYYAQPRNASAPITLHFEDGSHATCDVLIGADGVKSAVRASLVQELAARASSAHEAEELRRAAEPRWSGTSAYRATIPAEMLRALLPGHRVLSEPTVVRHSPLSACPLLHGARSTLAKTRYVHSFFVEQYNALTRA